MEQTSIERIGLKEPRSWRVKRLWRSVAATALTATAAVGIYHLEISNERSANAESTPAESTLVQRQSNVLELQFMKKAMLLNKRDEQIHKEQMELWFDTIIWNNAAKQRIPYDRALWESNHECEQPDSWHAGGYFGNGELSSGGGEGMSMDAWHMAVQDAARRGVTLPPTAWTASIDQQMQAAQVFLEDEGWGWGCPPNR